MAACSDSGNSTGSDTAKNNDTISPIEPMDSEGGGSPVDDENATDSNGEGDGDSEGIPVATRQHL